MLCGGRAASQHLQPNPILAGIDTHQIPAATPQEPPPRTGSNPNTTRTEPKGELGVFGKYPTELTPYAPQSCLEDRSTRLRSDRTPVQGRDIEDDVQTLSFSASQF